MNLLPLETPGSRWTLQIRVLEYQGMTTQLVWDWPNSGSSHLWLDQILSGLEGISSVFVDIACHCRIERSGSHELPTWWLSIDLADLNCLVNGKLLASLHRLRLNHGDEIELGVARLQVLLPGNPLQRQIIPGLDDPLPNPGTNDALQRAMAAPPRGHDPADSGTGGFELADLIAMHNGSSEDTAEANAEWAKMFVHTSLPDQFGVSISSSSSSGIGDVDAKPPPDFGPVTLHAQVPTPKIVEDPLRQLHEEYLFRLRNPHESKADEWRDVQQADQISSQDDEFARLRELGGAGSLHDILGKPQSIQGLLEKFDALGDNNLLMPESFENVMQLFAPADLKRDTITDVDTHLPSLTRREHHNLSLDSSISIPGQTPNANWPSEN